MLENCLENENQVIAYNNCVIKHTFRCYCFQHLPKDIDTQYIYISKPEISKKDMYDELNKKYNEDPSNFPVCNHVFCEDFYRCSGSDVQFECFMGS
jgi:hypothetical protein